MSFDHNLTRVLEILKNEGEVCTTYVCALRGRVVGVEIERKSNNFLWGKVPDERETEFAQWMLRTVRRRRADLKLMRKFREKS